MDNSINQLVEKIQINQFNHHNQQRLAIDFFQNMTEGNYVLQNGTSPIVSLLEHNTACCVANNIAVNSLFRDLTREHAKSIDDLVRYIDMAQKNDIHATPGSTIFNIALRVADLKKHSILLPNGSRRVVIPEDTLFSYKDTTYYGIHHAIEITYYSDDNIDVRYIDNNNPLYELENPVLEVSYHKPNDIANASRELLIDINIKAFQFRREQHLYSINKTTGFSETYNLTDQYYHVRVFNRVKNNWVELRTEIGEFAYNPADRIGVAVVHLNGREVRVDIPQIYLSEGIISNQVKVVMYTTKGKIVEDYKTSIPDDFAVEFHNNTPALADYVGPLNAFGTIYAYSRDKVVGGEDMPTLEEIRQDLLAFTMDGDVPITRQNLQYDLESKGYELVHEHNYIDENLYIASKRVEPLRIGPTQIQIASGGIGVVLGDMTNKHGVIINGDNYTITPNIITKYTNGLLNILTESEVNQFNNLSIDNRVNELNNNFYLTTPFYYLVERGDTTHECRAYDLSCPEVVSRHFINANPSTVGLIGSSAYTIKHTERGYILELTAIVNNPFLEMPDDAFIPQLKTVNVYGNIFSINGEFVKRGENGEYHFEFLLTTKYDLRTDDTMVIDSLVGPSGDFHMPLTNRFDLTYNQVKQLPATLNTALKENTVSSRLPEYYLTITHETITLKVGSSLPSIYTPTKALRGAIEYEKYEEDVLAYWTEDVYDTDEQGFVKIVENPNYDPNDPNSSPFIYPILHRDGDPILNKDGVQEIKHHKGDLILDSKGDPIPTKRQTHSIETRLIMIDYKYHITGNYMDNLRGEIIEHIKSDIEPLQAVMIDLSKLRYNLSNCLGSVKVRHDRNRSFDIPAALEFKYVVNVDKVTYGDIQMREVISDAIKSTTSEYMKGRRYARNELIARVDKAISGNVVSFDVQSVGGREDIIGFTLVDDADIVGIKGVVYVDTDGNLQLTDGIDVSFEIV